MKKGILIILVLALSACARVEQPEPTITINNNDFEVNGDTIIIDEIRWKTAGLGGYPFTVGGDLACSNDSVEFYPQEMHEQDIMLPTSLNPMPT